MLKNVIFLYHSIREGISLKRKLRSRISRGNRPWRIGEIGKREKRKRGKTRERCQYDIEIIKLEFIDNNQIF